MCEHVGQKTLLETRSVPGGGKSHLGPHRPRHRTSSVFLPCKVGPCRTCHNGKDLLDQLHVVGLVELSGKLRALEVLQHFKQQVQPCLCYVALRMPEGPNYRIDHLFMAQALG